MQKKFNDCTAIIATLGERDLRPTLNSLFKGSLKPKSVIISLPQKFNVKYPLLYADRLKIVKCPYKSQVMQRHFGFALSKSFTTLQIDDDVVLHHNCLEKLVTTIFNLKCKSAVAPLLLWKGTHGSVYQDQLNRPWWFHWILNKTFEPKPGKISKSGEAYGISVIRPFSETSKSPLEVEWLPGGCVLHKSENLVHRLFYPWSGKAYGEDLFHSHCLIQNGVKLFIEPNAHAFLQKNKYLKHPISLKDLFQINHLRKKFLKTIGKSTFHAQLLFYCQLSSFYLKKLTLRKK